MKTLCCKLVTKIKYSYRYEKSPSAERRWHAGDWFKVICIKNCILHREDSLLGVEVQLPVPNIVFCRENGPTVFSGTFLLLFEIKHEKVITINQVKIFLHEQIVFSTVFSNFLFWLGKLHAWTTCSKKHFDIFHYKYCLKEVKVC